MQHTAISAWIYDLFAGYNYFLLGVFHSFAEATGGFFTPFFEFVSLLAEKGIAPILLGFALLLFKRTRRTGFALLLALLIGMLITNCLLKNIVAMPRPFADEAHIYHEWWLAVGAHSPTDFSFPSGHTTAAMAAMTVLFLSFKKRYSFIAFIPAILIAVSRMYLMVHYPSDILGGLAVGIVAAVSAYFIAKFAEEGIKSHQQSKAAHLWLSFDIIDCIKSKSAIQKQK